MTDARLTLRSLWQRPQVPAGARKTSELVLNA